VILVPQREHIAVRCHISLANHLIAVKHELARRFHAHVRAHTDPLLRVLTDLRHAKGSPAGTVCGPETAGDAGEKVGLLAAGKVVRPRLIPTGDPRKLSRLACHSNASGESSGAAAPARVDGRSRPRLERTLALQLAAPVVAADEVRVSCDVDPLAQPPDP
jgi:hypothetical protein